MLINAETFGNTGAIEFILDDELVHGVIELDTVEKYVTKTSKDSKGNLIVSGGEVQKECVVFDTAHVYVDNIVIEVY